VRQVRALSLLTVAHGSPEHKNMSNQNSSQSFRLERALFDQVAAHLKLKLVGPADGIVEEAGNLPIVLVEGGKQIHEFKSADELVDALLRATKSVNPDQFKISETAIKSATNVSKL
jgi:hypothetical protein